MRLWTTDWFYNDFFNRLDGFWNMAVTTRSLDADPPFCELRFFGFPRSSFVCSSVHTLVQIARGSHRVALHGHGPISLHLEPMDIEMRRGEREAELLPENRFIRTFDGERSWPDHRDLIQLRLLMHRTIPRSERPW
jgi:hypothetical protein